MIAHRRATHRALVVLASLVSSVLLPASGASAALADDGLWYFDTFHIQDAHDAGFTGAGVTIAVIDGQINLEAPQLVGADIRVEPSVCYGVDGELSPATSTDVTQAFHGTHVVSLLVGSGVGYAGQVGMKGVAPDANILYTSVGPIGADGGFEHCLDPDGERIDPLAVGIFAAVEAGADIISVSMVVDITLELELAIATAEHAGIPILAGLPNDDALVIDRGEFPGVANGVVSVQAGRAGQVQTVTSATDVVGPGIGILVQGVGDSWETQTTLNATSLATPLVAGFVALVKQKYPTATGNQLIQTLIRNTGADDHELAFSAEDGYGYGSASATHMLKKDPTQYEDVNPLIRTDDDAGIPTAEMIADPPTLEEYLGAPDDGESPSPDAPSGLNLSALLLPALLGLGGLVVVVTVIIIVVVATRRSRTPPGAASGGTV